jgi:hypothetical protein
MKTPGVLPALFATVLMVIAAWPRWATVRSSDGLVAGQASNRPRALDAGAVAVWPLIA